MLSITNHSSNTVISKRRTRKVSSNAKPKTGDYGILNCWVFCDRIDDEPCKHQNERNLSIREQTLLSRAACLQDYDFFFGMESGFAAARWELGSEMHGVVHRITRHELEMLDKIEGWYVKDLVEVVPYRFEQKLPSIKTFVYVFDQIMVEKYPENFAENPPKARYMEILQDFTKETFEWTKDITATLSVKDFCQHEPFKRCKKKTRETRKLFSLP
jgi:gamma-glutamylcyclotransferase (GGCT)/AIG2-like uncharacterized protein YtfP